MQAGNIFDFNTAERLSDGEVTARVRSSVDADDLRDRLKANPRSFVEWLFSGRAYINGGNARIGDVMGTPGASLSIALTGPDAGLWHDHATGESGDLIGLYMAHMGYGSAQHFPFALKEIAAEFFGDPVPVERPAWQPTATARIAEKKQKLGDKPRADMLELGAPVGKWNYHDTRGNIVASVVRFEPDGTPETKTYRPWCFKIIDGERVWKPGAPELRPLYRLPEIAATPHVVLVEGEKCAEALAALGIEATTAMQGAKAPIEKTDWSPLAGKSVVVWPDNDAAGIDYGNRAAEKLRSIGCQVFIVKPPADKPTKWDAADCIAEHLDPHEILATAMPLPAKPKIKLLTLEELEALPPPTWLIHDVVTERGVSVVWGRSGTYKSFVALDMALCVATGRPWHGRDVRPGLVVYVAAEGAHGLAKRAIGWMKKRGDGVRPSLRLLPHAITLTGEDAKDLADAILALGERPALIVIDTLARTFGAGDENSTKDMNAFVTAIDAIKSATGAHVMVVHHSGKDAEKGERGNVALRGAADTMIAVERSGEALKLVNQAPKGKQKDAPEFDDINLRVQTVAFEHQGFEQTTLLLMVDDSPPLPSEKPGQTLGKNETAILEALKSSPDPLGFTRLRAMTNINSGSLTRSLETLTGKKLITESVVGDGEKKLWSINRDNS